MNIAIVGAGISGLYLAWKLSEKGHRVTVFEKKEKTGKEVCSGLFSEKILQFIPQSKNLIQNRIDFVLIHFPTRKHPSTKFWWGATGQGKTLKIQFSEKFYVMSHFELDNLMAKLAKNSGVKMTLKHNVTQQGCVALEKFDRIIGCDGANSVIRKSLGLPEPKLQLAIQGFLLPPTNAWWRANFVETWPIKSGGFLWKIPRGNQEGPSTKNWWGAYGVRETEYGIMTSLKDARTIFEKFLAENNLHLERISSALVPQGLIIPSNPKITLCGDAAGLTKPWSGGGVVWSLLAAEILLKNFPDFIEYKKEVKKFFLPKIIFSKIATRIVYFLGFKIPWLLPKESKIEGDFLI